MNSLLSTEAPDDFPDLSVFARRVAEETTGVTLEERVRLIREAMEYIVTVERRNA